MSLYFNKKAFAANNRDGRAVKAQFEELSTLRANTQKSMDELHAVANTGVTPADTYREFDNTSVLEPKERGHMALCSQAMVFSRSISLGKQVYEYRQSSRSGNASISLSGRKNIVIDHTQYGYAGTCVLVIDDAFGRTWLEQKANATEMFDGLVDDSMNSERVVLELVDNYMWDGDSKNVKGRSWGGLRGDASVAQAVLAVDLADNSISGKTKYDEIRRLRDILTIENDCDSFTLVISREIKSSWEEDYAIDNSSNRTVENRIAGIAGITSIIEDAALTGNQIAMVKLGQDAFHPVVAMALSTYAIPRVGPMDDYSFVKWVMLGFIAKTSKAGKKCALYAE